MKKNTRNTSIRGSLISVKDYIVRHRFVLFIIIVAVIISFMFIRISMMSTAEPKSYEKAEAKSVKVIRIDEDSITVIKQLQDKNISIETLFSQDRYDPFNN